MKVVEIYHYLQGLHIPGAGFLPSVGELVGFRELAVQMGFPFHGRVIIFLKQVRYGDIYLGGGNSNIFYFHPDPWGNDPICLIYFSKGLGKNHPTSYPFLGFEIPFQEVVVVTIAS